MAGFHVTPEMAIYSVERRGDGGTKDVLTTSSFDEASRRFLIEARALAATFTPRREHRPDPPPPGNQHRHTWTQNTATAAASGVVAGLLVVPLAVAVVILFALAGSYDPGSDGGRWLPFRRHRAAFIMGMAVGFLGLLVAVGVVVDTAAR